MKIGIIGGGSIGLLLSTYLASQHEVTIYVKRNEQKSILNNQGLFLADTVSPISVHTLLLEEIQEADCFIICVKQHQIANVLPTLKKIKGQIPLLFLQNGMGHIEYLREINNNIYIGVVEHGALRNADNHVRHTGKGAIKIATYTGNTKALYSLTEQLNQREFPFQIAQDWKKLLAEKLIVNAVINPLTTLFNVPNKDILNNPYIFHLAKELCYEAAMVLQLDYHTQLHKIKEIIYQTGENMSSMLMDIKEGRQTEIDAISGYLMADINHELPYTSFVYNGIKALEVKNEDGKSDD